MGHAKPFERSHPSCSRRRLCHLLLQCLLNGVEPACERVEAAKQVSCRLHCLNPGLNAGPAPGQVVVAGV